MFDGLFGTDEEEGGAWETAPVAVARGSNAPTPSRGSKVPFVGLANQYALSHPLIRDTNHDTYAFQVGCAPDTSTWC